MNYLVTGGAGFIGSNIVKRLLDQNHNVKVLDNFSTGKRENILCFSNNNKFEMIEGDLRSFHIVREAVRGVDFILHQGALPSVPRSINDPITSNDVNVLGTLNVLEAAKEFNVKRVVYASSSSVYGEIAESPKHENMPVSPLSPYAVSKYAAERYCQIYYKLYGLETVVLRYFNVFGPNQDPNSQYSAVIPKFIKSIQNNVSPLIFGDGSQSRDFTFVENNVQANLLACIAKDAPGNVFNIACGESYSLNQLIELINKLCGTQVKPLLSEKRAGDILHSLASIDKAKQILSYKPEVKFEEGIKRTLEYFSV